MALDNLAEQEQIRKDFSAQKRRLRRSMRRVRRDIGLLEEARNEAMRDHELKTFKCIHDLMKGDVAVYKA